MNEESQKLKAALPGLEQLLYAACPGNNVICSPEQICTQISKIFGVRSHEVALLWIQGHFLKFLFPIELGCAGFVPLSSPAIASRTVTTSKAERFNCFARVKHVRVFELARLESSETRADQHETQVIQKLMSAPVINGNAEVVGVIQVCRKGMNAALAGPDFTENDLKKLEFAADIVARLMAMSSAVVRG